MAAVFRRIAIDEAMHASFGWRTAVWIVEQQGRRSDLVELMEQQLQAGALMVGEEDVAVLRALAGYWGGDTAARTAVLQAASSASDVMRATLGVLFHQL